MPPVPSHRPSPGHVPPVAVLWGFGVTAVPDLDDMVAGEDEDLPFVVAVVVEAVMELFSELGANGEGPTVETVVWVEEAISWLDGLFAAGEDVLPRVNGRGMCFDF